MMRGASTAGITIPEPMRKEFERLIRLSPPASLNSIEMLLRALSSTERGPEDPVTFQKKFGIWMGNLRYSLEENITETRRKAAELGIELIKLARQEERVHLVLGDIVQLLGASDRIARDYLLTVIGIPHPTGESFYLNQEDALHIEKFFRQRVLSDWTLESAIADLASVEKRNIQLVVSLPVLQATPAGPNNE